MEARPASPRPWRGAGRATRGCLLGRLIEQVSDAVPGERAQEAVEEGGAFERGCGRALARAVQPARSRGRARPAIDSGPGSLRRVMCLQVNEQVEVNPRRAHQTALRPRRPPGREHERRAQGGIVSRELGRPPLGPDWRSCPCRGGLEQAGSRGGSGERRGLYARRPEREGAEVCLLASGLLALPASVRQVPASLG